MKLGKITDLTLNLEGVAKKYQSKAGGLNEKGRKHYNSKGHNLKAPVSKKQAKKSSKSAGRRKSFCSRMGGQKKMHNIDCRTDPDKAICKSLKRWDCNEAFNKVLSNILSETFDKPFPYKWTRKTEDYWSAEFHLVTKLGNSKVVLNIMKIDNDNWDISFTTAGGQFSYGSFSIINTGRAYEIFATIMEAVKEWMQHMDPYIFTFSASEPSRIKLYSRLINKFLPSGWNHEIVKNQDEAYYLAKRGEITLDEINAYKDPEDEDSTLYW